VVNEFVDRAGISCFHRLSAETGAGAADLIKAQIVARAVFRADELDEKIAALDHEVPAQTQTALRLEVRTLAERATRWLVDNRRRPLDVSSAVSELGPGVATVVAALPEALVGREAEALARRSARLRDAGVPAELAERVAALPPSYAALTVVSTASRTGQDPLRVARVHFTLAQRLGLDRLLGRIVELPREDRWQTMARAALRDDLHGVHAQLTGQVLLAGGGPSSDRSPDDLVRAWERATPSAAESIRTLRSICSGRADLARVSVALRVVRGLIGS
jgi:glutamate dehydrogenase